MDVLMSHTDETWSPYISVQGIASIDPLTLAATALRAALIDKAIHQADGISHALQRRELTRFPTVVQSLHLETGGLGTARLHNMLHAFKRFMTDLCHADVREKLAAALRPMDSWVRGRYSVTSPALLVIQAILYSHCEWSREYLFEAYSAVRAFEELGILGFPEQDRRFIAALIAHQTLLRAAWSVDGERDPKEVLAFYVSDNEVRFVGESAGEGAEAELTADRAAGEALAQTLFKFLPQSTSQDGCPDSQQEHIPLRRRQLAAALVLHSLCLSCRHSHREPETLTKLKAQALRFLDHILAADTTQKSPEERDSQTRYHLAFFQYGRYVRQAQSNAGQFDLPGSPNDSSLNLLDEAKKGIKPNDLSKPAGNNVSICFQRVSTRRVWAEVTEDDLDKLSPDLKNMHEQSRIWELVEPTIGCIRRYNFKPEIYLLKALGLDPAKTTKIDKCKCLEDLINHRENEAPESLKHSLEYLLNAVQENKQHTTFEDEKYYPAPLVGQVLRQLRDARPDLFTPLRIHTRKPAGISTPMHSMGEIHFTVWLPNYEPIRPEADSPDKKAENKVWTGETYDPDLLIPRYVAAMVIGHLVSYAPREILLDYYSEVARSNWDGLIQRAIKENGGLLMQTYATQLDCEPSDFHSLKVLETHQVFVSQKDYDKLLAEESQREDRHIVGIDIGGTGIKCMRFKLKDLLDPASENVDKKEYSISIDTKYIGKSIEMDDECKKNKYVKTECLIEKIKKECAEKHSDDLFNHCIAVGVSLAAPVSQKSGVPLAPSGALQTLFGVNNKIWEANPLDLHQFHFHKAIREVSRKPETGEPEIVVAVLNDGDADIRDSKDELSVPTHDGTTVFVKAGTGIAFAVYHAGKSVELFAETAKAPLNLFAEPQSEPELRQRFQTGVLGDYCSKKGLQKIIKKLCPSLKEYHENPGTLIGPLLEEALGRVPEESTPRGAEVLEEEHISLWITKYSEQKDGEYDRELKKVFDRAICLDRLRRVSNAKKKLDAWQKAQTVELPDTGKQIMDGIESCPQYDSLSPQEKFAVGCAWILGRWLADAIAQVVDIYGAREIRLAGGPLSAATGLFVTASAEKALETIYGFDLDVVWDPHHMDSMTPYEQSGTFRRVREMKRLRLVYPPEKSSIGGPRGAAKAGLDAWIAHKKQDELRLCRDRVNGYERDDKFDAKKVRKDSLGGLSTISLVSDAEVALMLARESSTLGLTRISGEMFRKL